jgi:uncharacterized protein (DUF2147 family)
MEIKFQRIKSRRDSIVHQGNYAVARFFAKLLFRSDQTARYSTFGAPMKKLLLVALSSIFFIASGETGVSSPVGTWLAKDGAKIRIGPCGRNLCGFIAQSSPRNDPATGRPMTDKNNVDPAKRNRPLVGVQTLISMQPNGPGKWSGRLYNDDDGKIYSGNLIELGQSSIRIEGCALGVCGGDTLMRLK